MNTIFVYGTLLNDEVLELILDRIPPKDLAQLQGFQRMKVIREVFPAIRPEDNGSVTGLLLKELSDTEIESLDAYEGAFYEKQSVIVTSIDGVSHQCQTYICKPGYYDLLSDEPWSNEEFRENYLERFIRSIAE
jgi:gamma-glutamylcyclotransferase (GGCT)/AIG2-like uncharacterized protein YtfP